jgi:hypothetical protein
MELFRAHKQWATRPNDERFPSLQALYDATKSYAQDARESTVPYASLRTEAIDGDVQIVGKQNAPAKLTHWAFGQLAARVDAPASYLRTLPATLAVQNLNHGLKTNTENGDKDAKLLFHTNGGLLVRAFTSDIYARIWNWEVAERMLHLTSLGWEPATPDMWFAPSAGITVPVGERKTTALYASDHDLFAFLMNKDCDIREAGTNDPLKRGVIVENSEVGAAALKLTRFLYRMMCGNHIIWGASKVIELSVRHIGNARDRMMREWEFELKKYAQESASDQETKIAAAKRGKIAATKDEVLDRLFGIRNVRLSRKALEAGYDAVNPDVDGDPRSPWGMAQGLTRYSQTVPYADKRTDIDRAAGRILQIEF